MRLWSVTKKGGEGIEELIEFSSMAGGAPSLLQSIRKRTEERETGSCAVDQEEEEEEDLPRKLRPPFSVLSVWLPTCRRRAAKRGCLEERSTNSVYFFPTATKKGTYFWNLCCFLEDEEEPPSPSSVILTRIF